MSDEPKLKLVTPNGMKPLPLSALRAICSRPETQEFVVMGASRRWLYDLLGRVPGSWGIFVHEMSQGVTASHGAYHYVRRKKATSQRGVLIAEVRRCRKDLDEAMEALFLDIRVADAVGDEEAPLFNVADLLGEIAPIAETVTTFAGFLAEREAEAQDGT